ncbi:unnamed protein product [Durusdinium trenchii]|uniref:Protein xylosyltransferase n=1 Tax=Durusdinium trenchii TaxID=1381693 RepID=A0ABP0HKP0_9DINO
MDESICQYGRVYSQHPQPLPGSLPRWDERLRDIKTEAPPFISTLKPSATQKNPETLKQWWLKKSLSLPALKHNSNPGVDTDSRRNSLAWLTVSRSSKEGVSCRRLMEMAQPKNQDTFVADVRNRWHGQRKLFVHQVPKCATEVLQTLPGARLFERLGFGLDLIQHVLAGYLHEQMMSGQGGFGITKDPEEADLFYIPAFFSVLFWIGDLQALRCVAATFDLLLSRPYFLRHNGHDQLVLYGVEFDFYRSSMGFALTDYHPSAANWIILTVACPPPCGDVKDSWSLRSRFVLLPHASRCRDPLRREQGVPEVPRRFRIGYVGAVGQDFTERQAFFELTCHSRRWLQTEDGLWHESAPYTARHWSLDRNTTILDAFLLTERYYRQGCQELGRMSPSSQWNFWWVEKGWRWRLVPEAEPPDHGAYFRKAFCMPYYAFSDGRLGEQLEVKNGLRHPDDHHQTEFSQAEQREQPVFNSLLFESIYSHSEVCLVLRGDTADGTKRLWDAITRGCVPAFASSSIHWPLLPFWTQVPWQEFSFFFYGVNSSGKAFNVLETLRRLGPSLLRRKRQRLRQWLPSLVVEPQTCGMRRAHGRNRTGATGSTPAAARLAPPTALQLAMAEDPSDPEAPSLMWLLAEDGATEHSHVRVCDRNFVVLKVKRLLLNMEKDPFAGVFRSGCCSDMVCTDAHTPAAWCTTPCPPFRIRERFKMASVLKTAARGMVFVGQVFSIGGHFMKVAQREDERKGYDYYS